MKRAVKKATAKKATAKKATAKKAAPTKLLAGGNPQVAKGDGEAAVHAYLAAMPATKRPLGEAIDALIAEEVPAARRAVRWNSPFYGVEGQGWFLSFHCFTKYLKVTLFNGAELDPPPPVGSTSPRVRYVHLAYDAPLDEAALRHWIGQAAARPGEDVF